MSSKADLGSRQELLLLTGKKLAAFQGNDSSTAGAAAVLNLLPGLDTGMSLPECTGQVDMQSRPRGKCGAVKFLGKSRQGPLDTLKETMNKQVSLTQMEARISMPGWFVWNLSVFLLCGDFVVTTLCKIKDRNQSHCNSGFDFSFCSRTFCDYSVLAVLRKSLKCMIP